MSTNETTYTVVQGYEKAPYGSYDNHWQEYLHNLLADIERDTVITGTDVEFNDGTVPVLDDGGNSLAGAIGVSAEDTIYRCAGPEGWDAIADLKEVGNHYTAENARDDIAAALRQGENVTITVNDAGDTITVAASDTHADLSDGTTTAVDPTSTTVTGSGSASVTVTDNPDGSATLDIAATDTDTHAAVQDEGAVAVSDASALNFVGAGVTASANATDPNVADIDVPGGSGSGDPSIAAPGSVQTAIDAAYTAGGGVVKLDPSATYDPATAWDLKRDVTLDYNGAIVEISSDHNVLNIWGRTNVLNTQHLFTTNIWTSIVFNIDGNNDTDGSMGFEDAPYIGPGRTYAPQDVDGHFIWIHSRSGEPISQVQMDTNFVDGVETPIRLSTPDPDPGTNCWNNSNELRVIANRYADGIITEGDGNMIRNLFLGGFQTGYRAQRFWLCNNGSATFEGYAWDMFNNAVAPWEVNGGSNNTIKTYVGPQNIYQTGTSTSITNRVIDLSDPQAILNIGNVDEKLRWVARDSTNNVGRYTFELNAEPGNERTTLWQVTGAGGMIFGDDTEFPGGLRVPASDLSTKTVPSDPTIDHHDGTDGLPDGPYYGDPATGDWTRVLLDDSDGRAYALAAANTVTLASGSGTADTGIATDGGHYTVNIAPGAADVAASIDGSGTNYQIHFEENSTTVGNPTVGWQLLRSQLA